MSERCSETVLPGTPPIPVQWQWNARARRISLRVSRLDGRVTLTVPPRVARKTAEAFLTERQAWLLNALQGAQAPSPVEGGTWLPVDGRPLLVTPVATAVVEIAEDRLLVPLRGAPGTRIAAWLKLRARDRLAAEVADFAARLGQVPGALTLRDTRSRWGSCSSAGDLMFSWRLAMAPPPVLSYVAAHEVAHLAQMNHSPAYWAVLRGLMPDYAEHRLWLRVEGAALHRYRFAGDRAA